MPRQHRQLPVPREGCVINGLRLPLALAVTAVALLSVINVHAYRQAGVRETATFTIVSTDTADLRLLSNSPLAVVGSNGMLAIDFAYGNRTFQSPASNPTVTADTFQMRKVFRVNNPTSQCYSVQVYVPGATATNLTAIWGRDNGTGSVQLATTNGAQLNKFNMGTTATNQDLWLDFYWTASSTASKTAFQILVSATPRSCP